MGKRIKPLQPPDSFHLSAADGWLGLGDFLAATEELEKITAESRSHPDVLEIRWQIYAKEKRWEACVDIAKAFTELAPAESKAWFHLAYSTRQVRGGGLEAAIGILLPRVETFPKNPYFCFYLACYTAQLNLLVESTKWWGQALEIARKNGQFNKIRLMALDDPDLEPLLKGIGK